MFDYHFIQEQIRRAQHCHDCGKRLKFREIRRCEACKKIYKQNKKKNKE